jgi:hypothetical protein
MPTWLKPFKGATHSFADCELLFLQKVDPAVRDQHWRATDEVWFDYARLHPLKGFYYFCHVYGDAFGRYLESNIDFDRRYQRGIKGDPLESRELRSLLAVKNNADKTGMPYEVYLDAMFARFASNGWTRPPRPAHMANCAEGHEKAIAAWEERLVAMTMYARDPWFQVEQWVGHPQQRRYEDWLIESIRFREHRELALSTCLYEQGQLRIERALQEFGTDTVERALHCYTLQGVITTH